VNNSGVAERQQRQRQKIAEEDREKSEAFPHGIALIDAELHAHSLYDIRSYSCERDLKCWDDDPDKCDCSVHETLLSAKLCDAQYHSLVSVC